MAERIFLRSLDIPRNSANKIEPYGLSCDWAIYFPSTESLVFVGARGYDWIHPFDRNVSSLVIAFDYFVLILRRRCGFTSGACVVSICSR